MFESILIAVDSGMPDNFRCSVTRIPDEMNARVKNPCNVETSLGSFMVSSRDFFNFASGVQNLNNRSGGTFIIRIYEANGRPLEVTKRSPRGDWNKVAVGMARYTVPDPAPEFDGNGNTMQSSSSEKMILTLIEKMDQRNEERFREMGKQREPSALEKALEQKIIGDLVNPQTQTGGAEQVFATMMAMPVIVQKMADKMFPDSPVPPEPDWFDKVTKVAESPAGEALVDRLGGVMEIIASRALKPAPGTPLVQNAEPRGDNVEDLIEDLIAELESENEFINENQFLIGLANTYPTQAKMLLTMCQTMPFESVLNMLTAYMSGMNPNPLEPFVNVEETNKQNMYIWNERGNNLLVRLQAFYDYVKTIGVS